MNLITPEGKPIVGRLEQVQCCANIKPDSFRMEEGKLTWDWTGYTKVFWDEQRPIQAGDGDDIFLDEDGNEWLESDLFPQSKEKRFLVTWKMDIWATDEKEAARKALDVHRNPESIATVFEVEDIDKGTTPVRIDLGVGE